MKRILVLIGGGDRDEVIFRTALAAAVPVSAHLDCLHVHVSASVACQYDTHVQFAVGAGIVNALETLEAKAKKFSEFSAHHIRELSDAAKIVDDTKSVTASYREENDTTLEDLVSQARQNDIIVMGRAKQTQGLPPTTLEYLVRNCGRPVILAASTVPKTLTGTVMVCWKNSDNVRRAVATAMPLLAKAKRVVVASVTKRSQGYVETMYDLTRQFAKHGALTDTQIIPMNKIGISGLLLTAANDCGADLLVMGAYGRSRFQELIFGSCTEALISELDRPILLMH